VKAINIKQYEKDQFPVFTILNNIFRFFLNSFWLGGV